jgi:hypothetical protein
MRSVSLLVICTQLLLPTLGLAQGVGCDLRKELLNLVLASNR